LGAVGPAPAGATRAEPNVEAAAGSSDGAKDDIYLILSADAFAGLPTWHDPRRVLALAHLVVVPREGYADASPASLGAWFPDVADATTRAIFLDGPRLHLSASSLRARAAAGR